ncbi:rhodanese-like domain-containing protein [Pseudodesulfovibrio senegalensis]|uniref:Rhodanese-like domain-containing protein n=1 Tax=Pseudodesulfovibrio senegalensis TaxID=1721087 RepID=A0A6N6N5D3_9BACT|nr:rhodanese-like domain-containing protein [Pseudodesulfovibrio senegalensis]KAB1443392.1 rhodanese-like domain-containing protein [Pseudodesulfovibrio senegalensis]
MENLNAILKDMNFEFFGSGSHSMNVDVMAQKVHADNVILLDVRTDKEVEYVRFPFAKHIPLNELPDRLGELPKEKLIVPFCSSEFRGVIAYTYLLAQGYENVRALSASMEDMIKKFKPGPLAKA